MIMLLSQHIHYLFFFFYEVFSIYSDFSCFVAMHSFVNVEMIDPCRFMRRSVHTLFILVFSEELGISGDINFIHFNCRELRLLECTKPCLEPQASVRY